MFCCCWWWWWCWDQFSLLQSMFWHFCKMCSVYVADYYWILLVNKYLSSVGLKYICNQVCNRHFIYAHISLGLGLIAYHLLCLLWMFYGYRLIYKIKSMVHWLVYLSILYSQVSSQFVHTWNWNVESSTNWLSFSLIWWNKQIPPWVLFILMNSIQRSRRVSR